MTDSELRDVLCSVLEVVREQIIYSHRLHGWVIAASETIEQHPELSAKLKAHRFFDQGPRLDIYTSQKLTEKLDALILKLRHP
jgi:hypothetical protein